MRIIGKSKPPDQVLYGQHLFIDINPDTSQNMLTQQLRRRCRVMKSSGIINPRIRIMQFEIFACGAVMRIDVDDTGEVVPGTEKRVPEGHSDWRWAKETLAALHSRKKGHNPNAPLPPDLVEYRTGPATCQKTGD